MRSSANTGKRLPTLMPRSQSSARRPSHIVRAPQPSGMPATARAPKPTTTKRSASRTDIQLRPMYYLRLEVEPERVDTLLAELWEAGTAGVVEGDGFVEAFFDDFEAAARFGTPMRAADRDWVQETEDAWPPLLVGEKFFVVAPWRKELTPPGRFRLEINPGMQCGTGQHPCTRLCLEAMERIIQPGDRVLDVGTGSGILSIAAKMLGAATVVACDVDSAAAREALFFIGS